MTPDEAYANSAYIPDGEGYYARWAEAAQVFRAGQTGAELGVEYGSGARQWYDFYAPVGPAQGTVIFVHGGYWMAGSPRDFSHLGAGSLEAGLSFAMVAHTLAPMARISDITAEVTTAIGAIAARTKGPLHLVGHSAGGHLVARMNGVGADASWLGRVARVMPISPLSDLEPLMQTSMNATLGIDAQEAVAESPVSAPKGCARPATVWVGAAERPAFLDQASWLADHWGCAQVIEPARHHFDVIEGLEDADSAMMTALLS